MDDYLAKGNSEGSKQATLIVTYGSRGDQKVLIRIFTIFMETIYNLILEKNPFFVPMMGAIAFFAQGSKKIFVWDD